MRDKGSMAGKSESTSAPGRKDPELRRRLLAAMLEVTGEVGYRRTTIELVAGRGGASVAQFDRHFADCDSCFLAAYEATADALLASMLAAAAGASSWRAGVRAALAELFAFATERPAVARGVLKEVYVAGGRARARHEEVLERLSSAVAGTCRETAESRHSPPPNTAAFMVGAIEESVRWRLEEKRPELLWQTLPELMQMVVAPYLGDAAAREELDLPASGAAAREN